MHERADQHAARIAARRGALSLEVGVFLFADLDGRRVSENHLAPFGREALSASALAGLNDQRMALRRARNGERPARFEALPLVIEPVHLRGIREAAACFVDDQRIVRPGVPMAEHDLHELVGLVVALVMLDDVVAPHVARLDVVEGGDDVPCAAAVAHEIERGEHARDVEGLVIRRRVGHAEAEPLGRHAHGHHAGDGVHLHAANAVLDGLRIPSAVELRHAEPVVEEGELELSRLQHLADVAVEVRRHEIRARVRMAPGGGKIGAVLRLQESDQRHLSHVVQVLEP